MRKLITLAELEQLMSSKEGIFDATSEDMYSFSIDIVCIGAKFEEIPLPEGGYTRIVLIVNGSEIQIDSEIIEAIYLDDDGTITLIFTINLPDLEIKYRD